MTITHTKNPDIFLLGLTGSIATGKSTVLNMFEQLGYATFSADAAVHELYEAEVVPFVSKIVPQAIKNNRVDRQVLAEILVKEPAKLAPLEKIIHPLVKQHFDKTLARAIKNQDKLLVVDIPLLFEGKNQYELDAIAVTYCDEREQLKRALSRPNMTKEKLETILARQMPQDQKRKHADFEIDTNQSLQKTKEQVVDIAAQCLAILAVRPHTGK